MAVSELQELQLRERLDAGGLSELEELNIREALDGGSTPPQTQTPTQEPSFFDKALGVLETGASIGSSIIAEPVAGITGLAKTITSGSEAGEEVAQNFREALAFQPRTQEGREGIQAVGEFLKPVGEVVKGIESGIGDFVFEQTGSPALAALSTTIPTGALEALGFKGTQKFLRGKRAGKVARTEKRVSEAISEAAPSIDQLKTTARGVYKEIDELGTTIKPNSYRELTQKLNKITREGGIDPQITPKATQALERFNERIGDTISTTELDTLRKVAQNAAKSIEPAEAALGAKMIDTVDSFLDAAGQNALNFPKGTPANLASRYKVARQLWGRARRSELLGEAFEKARNQASGFENGVRTQFRSILNNKKQRRFFNQSELAAIQRVVRGGTKENLFKLVGKLGFSEGQATQLVGTTIGIGGGAAIGGPVGAVVVPLIGTVSKKLAQRLTVKGASFADQVVRAGKDANKITKAYLKNTPKSQRSASELSELLLRNDIDLSKLPLDELSQAAGQFASDRRLALTGAAVTGAGSQQDGQQVSPADQINDISGN